MKDFEKTCRENDIRYTIHSEAGSPFRAIIEESKFHDFIILGQKTFFRHGIGREPGNTLHRILHNGLTAVFAVPDSAREIKKVLVAYDNSVQVTKAIQMFLLLHIWNQCDITLLNISNDANRAKQLLDRLGEYVGRYGIQPAKVHLRGRPDKAILSYIREHEIDLLVMGAYGKRTASEFVFGSVDEIPCYSGRYSVVYLPLTTCSGFFAHQMSFNSAVASVMWRLGDWDAIAETERKRVVDDLVHEDRAYH